MREFLSYFLPLYFIIYFGFAFILKSLLVAKRIGKNPLVLPNNDSAYGLIGFYFKIVLISMFLYVCVYGIFQDVQVHFLPIHYLEIDSVRYFGLGSLGFALVWTIVAQNHMRDSWRIGIDNETHTDLIVSGLFAISRNPIFFGMILSLIGLFLTTPNALTALFLVVGYILIQIQIRLEEEFLLKQHKESYQNYKNSVRRFI